MNRTKTTALATVIVVMTAIGGCATHPEPFGYHPDNELKTGQGLFSGGDGVFTLYRKPIKTVAAHPAGSESGRQEKENPPPGQP